MTFDAFLDLLDGVKGAGSKRTANCPAHDDKTPSLSVREGDDGRVLVRCHAGCTVDKVCASLGLRLADLFPGPPIDWSRFTPRTPEERQAAELRKVRRKVRALELDHRRATIALHRASILIAIAYSDDPNGVLERLWEGACAELDPEGRGRGRRLLPERGSVTVETFSEGPFEELDWNDVDAYLSSLNGANGEVRLSRDAPGTHPWLLDAGELLAEPDPGPTPFLVDGLIVAQAIVAMVGRWKTTKSYALLYLLACVALGEPAWGMTTTAGPVVYVCEESGRAAMWRRLDQLCRGYGFDPDRLRGQLHVSANARVRLDDPGWQEELMAVGRELRPRMFAFDPLARMKEAKREENSQTDMAVVLEFFRDLRDETGAGVGAVHHQGHSGTHMRGTSDMEAVWETKLEWKREAGSSEVTIASEHRDTEACAPIRYRISWDHETRTMRFPLIEADLEAKVRAHLAEHPTDSANDVFDVLGGTRKHVLDAVKKVKDEVVRDGRTTAVPPPPGQASGVVRATPSLEGSRTTSGEPSSEVVREASTSLLEDPDLFPREKT